MFSVPYFFPYAYGGWVLAPPLITWVMAILAFVLAIVGLPNTRKWYLVVRGIVTLLFSLGLIILLLLPLARESFVGKELIHTTESPNGEYMVDFYRMNGGAATSFWIVGELDGPLWLKKTVFYDYRMDEVEVAWVDDTTLMANLHQFNLAEGEVYIE